MILPLILWKMKMTTEYYGKKKCISNAAFRKSGNFIKNAFHEDGKKDPYLHNVEML